MPLLRELQENNPDDFRNYLWMTDPVFHRLLALLTPYIMKQHTCMRQAITPKQRLVATLQYLAMGRSLQDLKTGISGIIIPETCSAIIQVLQKDYIKVIAECKNVLQFGQCVFIFLYYDTSYLSSGLPIVSDQRFLNCSLDRHTPKVLCRLYNFSHDLGLSHIWVSVRSMIPIIVCPLQDVHHLFKGHI
ncbi:hypothetical protein AB205_0005790 [Aquarana catesbeiana]|nr:hypothetical protein AB205_0005790 [Aquarana catesbeiana]